MSINTSLEIIGNTFLSKRGVTTFLPRWYTFHSHFWYIIAFPVTGLPAFKHHDAKEDAITCAKIFLKLQDHDTEKTLSSSFDEFSEFKGMLKGILADEQVNYKEAYGLLYWLEDHTETGKQYQNLYLKIKEVLDDDHLDCIEATDIKVFLEHTLRELE